MRKYWNVLQTGIQNDLAYRANFILWRIRQIIVYLVPFFIWTSVLREQGSIYGYDLKKLMTYVFATILLRSLVFGSRSIDLASIINNGDLTLYLLKPINIFNYWFVRDLGDKLINLFFIFFELPLLFFLLKPPLIFQTKPLIIFQTSFAIATAIVLFFFINFIFGMIGFWSREVWAPRFLLFIIIEFTSGGIFPLDMLPIRIQTLLNLTPFPYLLFFPINTYLGKVNSYWLTLLIPIFWIFALKFLSKFIWQKGLKVYEAEGR